jgi:hypothetical protein
MVATIEMMKIEIMAAQVVGVTQFSSGPAGDGASGETAPLVDEAAAALGDNGVLLHKAFRLILSFVASESAEIVPSLWSMVMMHFLYYGRNKPWFYVIRDICNVQEAYHVYIYICVLYHASLKQRTATTL